MYKKIMVSSSCSSPQQSSGTQQDMGIWEFLAKNNINIAVLEQPPHSPDQAPCDFFLFPKLK